MKTHNEHCRMSFGRPTKEEGKCPRCDELRSGAAPRKGWGHAKKQAEMRFTQSLKRHDCKASRCGPVCTFGDW